MKWEVTGDVFIMSFLFFLLFNRRVIQECPISETKAYFQLNYIEDSPVFLPVACFNLKNTSLRIYKCSAKQFSILQGRCCFYPHTWLKSSPFSLKRQNCLPSFNCNLKLWPLFLLLFSLFICISIWDLVAIIKHYTCFVFVYCGYFMYIKQTEFSVYLYILLPDK